MRETMKNLIKNTITSIGIALTVFCVTGMVFDIAYDGNFSLDNYQFSKMVYRMHNCRSGFWTSDNDLSQRQSSNAF